MAQHENSGLGGFIVQVYRSHTHTHTRKNSSEPVIRSPQRPLPTKHTTNTRHKHPWPQGVRSRIPSNQVALDLHFSPRCYRNQFDHTCHVRIQWVTLLPYESRNSNVGMNRQIDKTSTACIGLTAVKSTAGTKDLTSTALHCSFTTLTL